MTCLCYIQLVCILYIGVESFLNSHFYLHSCVAFLDNLNFTHYFHKVKLQTFYFSTQDIIFLKKSRKILDLNCDFLKLLPPLCTIYFQVPCNIVAKILMMRKWKFRKLFHKVDSRVRSALWDIK